MGWDLHITNSYRGVDLWRNVNFATYTNTSGVDQLLKSLEIGLGVGANTFTAGDIVTGSGESIKLKLYVDSISATVTIDHLTDKVKTNSQKKTYPDPSDFTFYTFTFSEPIRVNNQASVTIKANIVGGDGNVLCFEKWTGIKSFNTSAVEEVPSYQLTIDRDTHSIAKIAISNEASALSISVPAGTTKTIYATPNKGYHFKEWTGFTTTVNNSSYSFSMPNTNIIAKAWGDQNLLTIDPNGGEMIQKYDPNSNGVEFTASPFAVQFVENQYRILGNFAPGEGFSYMQKTDTIGEPVRIGYTFNGWGVTTDNGYVQRYDPQDALSPWVIVSGSDLNYTTKPSSVHYYAFYDDIAENAEIQAMWKENFLLVRYYSNEATEIKYNGNKYTEEQLNQITSEFKYDTNYPAGLADGNNQNGIHLTKTGYNLTGNWLIGTPSGEPFDWFFSGTGKEIAEAMNKSIDNSSLEVEAYAEWKPKEVEVTFHKNDGSIVVSRTTFTYDIPDQQFFSPGWVRPGYELLGWSTSANATEAVYSIENKVSNNWINTHSPTIDLYAVWKLKGFVWIYDETSYSWKKAIPHIYNNGNWQPATPCIYNNSDWKICGE